MDSRDDHFQAAFPLRGKVLNVLRASPEDIFKNKEIVNMIKIIGTGIQFGKKMILILIIYDLEKLLLQQTLTQMVDISCHCWSLLFIGL